MNGVLRFHTLRWVRVNSSSISGCCVEEFIDTTRNYHKAIWSDGYTEITELHATRTGEMVKEPKTSSILSVYKSPKICYNIYVNKINKGAAV